MATLRQWRSALRQRFGAYGYRITRDGEIHRRTSTGWVLYGYVGDRHLEVILNINN